jgi:hypothetical protein
MLHVLIGLAAVVYIVNTVAPYWLAWCDARAERREYKRAWKAAQPPPAPWHWPFGQGFNIFAFVVIWAVAIAVGFGPFIH